MRPGPDELATAMEAGMRPSAAAGVLRVCMTAERGSRRFRVESIMDAGQFRTDVWENSEPFVSFGCGGRRAWEKGGTLIEYETAFPGQVERLQTVPGGVACIFGSMTATWEHPDSCIATLARTIRTGAEMPDEEVGGVSCRVFYRSAGECKSESGVLVEHRVWIDERTNLPRRVRISQTFRDHGTIANEQVFSVIERLEPGTAVEWRPERDGAS